MAPPPKKCKMKGDPVLLFDNKSIGSGQTPELLTAADVAGLFNVSITSVRRLQQQRQIPFLKVGGSVRFLRSDIVQYLQKRRVEPIDT